MKFLVVVTPPSIYQVAHNGLVEAVRWCLGIFYSDYGMIGSREPDWLHHLMNVLVGLFWRYGLVANISKSGLMTCQLGALRSRMFVESKVLKCTGVG